MQLVRRGFLGLLGMLVAASAAAPQELEPYHERIFEITPLAGVFLPDDNINYKSTSALVGLRASLNNSVRWSLEGEIALSPAQQQNTPTGIIESYRAQRAYDTAGRVVGAVITDIETRESELQSAANLFLASGAVLFNLRSGKVRPFLSAGAGFIDDISNSGGDPPSPFSNLFFQGGFGVRYARKSGWGWRVEARDIFFRDDKLPRENPRAALVAAQSDWAPRVFQGPAADGVFRNVRYSPVDYRGKRWLNNFSITASVTVPLGWVWKDGDGDQIEDRFDTCLTTAPSVVVDAVGCGIDTDGDNVFDGIDRCGETPLGATVDLTGCPSDTDGDGVFDGIDVADDTPAGALVDTRGQHFDTDTDGIWDGLDLCNDTPSGASIDENGCADDPLEAKLLRGEPILVTSVEFEGTSNDIEPLSYHYVNKAARLIERWTGSEEQPLRIEIGVHTDGVGEEGYNQSLTDRRAEALRVYMLENFFGMGANNLIARGYGESQTIGSDQTEEGRTINRRVEIRNLGPGDPPEDYDFGVDEEEESEGAEGAEGDADEAGEADAPTIPEEPELPDELELPEEPELPDFEDGE